MTIAYKLFGIPRTFDEFVDKVKRKGDNKVDVILGEENKGGLYGGLFDYNCIVSIKSGKTRLKLNEHTYLMGVGGFESTQIGLAEVRQATLKDLIETAEKLQSLNLEATINGKPIDEAREAINQYIKSESKRLKKLSES